ncbi:hypothetical protein ABT095_25555 [Kitasatospora sp. NPDC002227]|uniref:hypothetical protein n=1 Tax=Kitasatospora sp. NPDC002227 TaxID=3154773 RepID=UPI003322AD9C
MFALLALVAGIVTDLHDRDFPQALGARSRIGLNFHSSALTERDAQAALQEMDDRLHLGLVKIAPDLAGDGNAKVYVPLSEGNFPAEFRWFGGGAPGQVLGRERLDHSPPDGTYLLTGDRAGLGEVEKALVSSGVQVDTTDASVVDSFVFVAKEGSFGAAVLAAFALVVALALFWLSARARGRALRVLAGCQTSRIHAQDLSGFAGVLLASSAAVALVAGGSVVVTRGWPPALLFLQVLAGLEGAVIAASLCTMLALSVSAWPGAAMLARRRPAVHSLRKAASVVQALTFVLVAAAAGPAWAAHKYSSAQAAETAQWSRLSDQVGIRFNMGGGAMDWTEPRVGQLVEEAEAQGSAAFSYTMTPQDWSGDLGGYSAVAFVNQAWMNLFSSGPVNRSLSEVPFEQVRQMVVEAFGEQFEIWSRNKLPGNELMAQFRYVKPVGEVRIPVNSRGGSLMFPDNVLIAVMPSLFGMINDRNLTSLVSTRHIVFAGLTPIQGMLEQHRLTVADLRAAGFGGDVDLVYIAEEGLLKAQFAAHVTWLLNLALLALVVAFVVAAVVSAVISAQLHTKRDFPLRTAGHPWAWVLRDRVAKEVLAGAGLMTAVILVQQSTEVTAVLTASAFGLSTTIVSHLIAARWCFSAVSRRKI